MTLTDEHGQFLKILVETIRSRLGDKARKITAFARILKVTHSTASRWLSGNGSIGTDGIGKLADAINATTQEVEEYLRGERSLDDLMPEEGSPVRSKWLVQGLEAVSHLSIDESLQLMQQLISHQHQLLQNKTGTSQGYEILVSVLRSLPPTIQSLATLELASKYDWQVKDFAEDADLEESVVQGILQGSRPTDRELINLASVLTKTNGNEWTTHELIQIRDKTFLDIQPKPEKQPNGKK